MCERCARNTQIKRLLADVLYRAPAADDLPAQALPGFTNFLGLARLLEETTRLQGDDIGTSAPANAFRSMIYDMSAEERTDVIRLSQYILDMAAGIRQNVGAAKIQLKDPDGTTFSVTLEGGDLVLRINGVESSRTPLGDRDPEEALSAAERAMEAHRNIHGAH
jgi:hypothetical protein